MVYHIIIYYGDFTIIGLRNMIYVGEVRYTWSKQLPQYTSTYNHHQHEVQEYKLQ